MSDMKGVSQAEIDAAAEMLRRLRGVSESTMARGALKAARDARRQPYRAWRAATRDAWRQFRERM